MDTITLPYDINNGQPLDADKVMANLDEIVNNYNDSIGDKTGDLVSTDDSQELKNKTVTSPSIGGSVSGGANYIKPTLSGSVQNVVSDDSGAFDLSTSNVFTRILDGTNGTLSLSNVSVGQFFMIELVQDAVGGRIPTWFTTIKWTGGTAPTLSTAANKKDSFMFRCTGANTFDGYIAGMGL